MPSDQIDSAPTAVPVQEREALLMVLSAAAFLVFFQSYLVAPLIPTFAHEFHTSTGIFGLLVPAYVLPYGFSTLFYGPLSDRVGRGPVILTLLTVTVVTTAGVATCRSPEQMIMWRVIGGVATGGIIPIGLALLGDLYPYEQRGRPIGWMFGAIAGGMAFGSTLGALLNPLLGWRNEFLVTAALCCVVLFVAVRHRHSFSSKPEQHPLLPAALIRGYISLYSDSRAARGYAYIFLNGVFHSGVFSWLGLYFSRRYGLGDVGIGLALLGYGLPGMLLGPFIGGWADSYGRSKIIPLGILVAALSSAFMIPRFPLACPILFSTTLSLGYDMSHPLLAGIITSVTPARRGLAMGMNAFVLFSGFGSGTLLFELALRQGFAFALGTFSTVQLALAVMAVFLFRRETAITRAG